jgi:hypothetical protein
MEKSQKTNTLSIVSLIVLLIGFVWLILPHLLEEDAFIKLLIKVSITGRYAIDLILGFLPLILSIAAIRRNKNLLSVISLILSIFVFIFCVVDIVLVVYPLKAAIDTVHSFGASF